MSIFNGKKLSIEILGESHSKETCVKVKGFPEYTFNQDELTRFLQRRKASNSTFSTPRIENDIPEFSNVINNKVNGEFSAVIKNNNVKNSDYNDLYAKPRPSHADYAWYKKEGQLDFSGGGRFSARLTACLCVVGGIAKQFLVKKGINVCAYLQSVGKVQGCSYKNTNLSYEKVIEQTKEFPSIDKQQEMTDEIATARSRGDSVGGVIECLVCGMPAGVGDNLFEGLEGKISSLLFSVPAVKGVEFGSGFDMASSYGSLMNDVLQFENGNVVLKSNNNGGINGGISNGFDITMRVALKPTPSISIEQDTIDLLNATNTKIKIHGRHDSCVAVRAVPCIESAVAIAILDEII